MLDQVLGLLGQLQESNSLAQTKSFRIRKIALDAPNLSYTILAEEARTASVLTPLLEALGLVEPPYVVESKLTSDGCGLVVFRESSAEQRSIVCNVVVSRKHLCGYVLACDRPTRAKYVIMGLITIFTLIGPLVAYWLYKKQKHKVSFGFDSASDLGLVLTFVGGETLETQARELMDVGRKYLVAAGDDCREDTTTATPPSQTSIAAKDFECRIDGQFYQVTKSELIQMARDGRLKRSDELRRPGQVWVIAERVNGLFT
jgi:hypothetical protein